MNNHPGERLDYPDLFCFNEPVGGYAMGPEQDLIWISTRLRYYRRCQTFFAGESREFRYLEMRIREFENHVCNILRDYRGSCSIKKRGESCDSALLRVWRDSNPRPTDS